MGRPNQQVDVPVRTLSRLIEPLADRRPFKQDGRDTGADEGREQAPGFYVQAKVLGRGEEALG